LGDFIASNGRTYDKVVYRNVYDGIDVLYRQTPENHFEFMFLIRPAGDPADIKIAYRGAKRVSLDDAGHLDIRLANTRLVEKAPFAYQRDDIGAHAVGILPRLDNQDRLGFRVGDYDRDNVLIIDPEMNNPPTAITDSYWVVHDHTLETGSVLGNDFDPDEDPLTASLVSGTSNGELTFNADGNFTYVPNALYVGVDSFTYRAFDGTSYGDAATAFIDVTNADPVAIFDSYSMIHGETYNGYALDNDYDLDGDELTPTLVSPPSHAAAFTFNADGTFTYKAASDWTGQDSFTYKITDGIAVDEATVFMSVGNDVPTVNLDEPVACCLGELTILNGWFADGDQSIPDGPYTTTVNWGDGSSEEEYQFATPGSFQFTHEYAAEGSYTITVQVQDDAGAVANAQVQARVVNVQTVEWVALDSPLDGNPGNGTEGTAIGQRIFPDKTNPGDMANRRRVRIQANVLPAVAGVKVYFEVVDVDDPSANSGPVDYELFGGAEIPDNRASGTLLAAEAFTDANGVAVVEFEVSMQPGDNWRAVASCHLADLTDIRGKQDDGTQLRVVDSNGNFLPTGRAKVSDVLTVWRRLHVEVDSMGPVVNNDVAGNVTQRVIGASTSTVTTSVAWNNDSANRFEGGTLTDGLSRDFPVISSSAPAGLLTLVVYNQLDPDAPAPALGFFSVVDDDLLGNGDDVPMPDTSTLDNAMNEAYVKVLFDVGDNETATDVFFVPNLEAGQSVDAWDSRNLNANNFWVAYVLGAFQGPKTRDNDPSGENDGKTTLGETGGLGISWIYLESIRDHALENEGEVGDAVVVERDVVVHEVAHAVANLGDHPVTGLDAVFMNLAIGETSNVPSGSVLVTHHTASRYLPHYLAAIRSTPRPRPQA
jgi:hypothetical protein